MIIVVEGPDGSGKSRLIQDLRHTGHHFIGITRSGPPRDVTELYAALHLLRHLPAGVDFVIDRHPAISEAIYGPIFREYSLVPTEAFEVAEKMRSVDWLIYCRPPIETIEANVQKTPQMEGVESRTADIVQAYDYYMARLRHYFKFRTYDYTRTRTSASDPECLKGSDDLALQLWGL